MRATFAPATGTERRCARRVVWNGQAEYDPRSKSTVVPDEIVIPPDPKDPAPVPPIAPSPRKVQRAEVRASRTKFAGHAVSSAWMPRPPIPHQQGTPRDSRTSPVSPFWSRGSATTSDRSRDPPEGRSG